jgi:ComF family protein
VDKSLTRLIVRNIKRMLQAGINLIIPPRCMGCGTMGSIWCESCQLSRRAPDGPSCPSCGLPRIFRECPACSRGISSFRVASIAAYQPFLSYALVAFKYRPDTGFAELLATWLQEKLSKLAWEPDVIVPVPLSKVRLDQRGYNQVDLITSALARLTSIPHSNSTIERVRDTRSQVGLDPRARFVNMKGAFHVENGSFHQERVLLIDDLLTTGATLLGCAEALFLAGAMHVNALAIARA